ncbi:MAG: ABC transporter permease subunit [Clostridia bacterium]|nr:ABC transporter permease subunit [Clostridia bacterium]
MQGRIGIKSVGIEQIEAGISMGFTKIQILLYIVLPQAIKVVFPVYKGEVITIIKLTSIVGYIGVQDLTRATDIIRSQTFDAFFPLILTTILYFMVIGMLILILNYIEKRINREK